MRTRSIELTCLLNSAVKCPMSGKRGNYAPYWKQLTGRSILGLFNWPSVLKRTITNFWGFGVCPPECIPLGQMRGYCTFSFHLSFPWTGGSIDVTGALEVDVFFHSDEVGCKLPHILSVIDDADHRVATREKIPVRRVTQETKSKNKVNVQKHVGSAHDKLPTTNVAVIFQRKQFSPKIPRLWVRVDTFVSRQDPMGEKLLFRIQKA